MLGVSLTPEFHELRRFFTEVKDSLPAADDQPLPVASQLRLLESTARLVNRGGRAVDRAAITPGLEEAFHGAAEALQQAADDGVVDLAYDVETDPVALAKDTETNRQMRIHIETVVDTMDQMVRYTEAGVPSDVNELPAWINGADELSTLLDTSIAALKATQSRGEDMESELRELQERAQKRSKTTGSGD
jgi:hypothetical protein